MSTYTASTADCALRPASFVVAGQVPAAAMTPFVPAFNCNSFLR
jgi:hypothetical protein